MTVVELDRADRRRPANTWGWGAVMNFGQAIESGFRRYADFNGRSSRSEYWYWFLFGLAVRIPLYIAQLVLTSGSSNAGLAVAGILGLLGLLISLAMIIPSLAIVVRRLHDTNRSGWWYFIVLTGIGAIVLLVWFCLKGTEGPNKYGADPFAGTVPATADVFT